VADQAHTSRLPLNSAALRWFLEKLTPEEQAEVLGEHSKALVMLGQLGAGGKGKGGRKKKGLRS
jgi:hypothetical protein